MTRNSKEPDVNMQTNNTPEVLFDAFEEGIQKEPGVDIKGV